jgi:hypothetical protein
VEWQVSDDAKPWAAEDMIWLEGGSSAANARTLATCRQRDELVEVLTEIARLKRGGIEATDSEEEWTAFWAERCGKYETAARAVLAKWGTP